MTTPLGGLRVCSAPPGRGGVGAGLQLVQIWLLGNPASVCDGRLLGINQKSPTRAGSKAWLQSGLRTRQTYTSEPVDRLKEEVEALAEDDDGQGPRGQGRHRLNGSGEAGGGG